MCMDRPSGMGARPHAGSYPPNFEDRGVSPHPVGPQPQGRARVIDGRRGASSWFLACTEATKMKRRVALIVGASIIVIGGAYWLLRPAPGSAHATARRSAKIDVRELGPAAAAPRADKPKPKMVMTESGLRPQ